MSFPFYLSYAALWILVIMQSLVLLGVVRMVYQTQQTGLTTGHLQSSGEEAPRFSAVDLSGTLIGNTNLTGHPRALLFVSPGCSSCTATLAEMEALRHKAEDHVVVICQAEREDCIRLAEEQQISVPIVADGDERISRLFKVSSVPTAVLIDENNRIQSYGQPKRGEELRKMFEQAPEAESQEVG
jgi:peroxiredoxin